MTSLKKLPFEIDLHTIEIYKLLSETNSELGELKGTLYLLPNPNLILSLINISESKDSSEIENIVTTYDDIFKELALNKSKNPETKEVINYKEAIELGFKDLNEREFISANSLVRIQSILEPNKPGIRKIPGTLIINDKTGEVVHTPPQNEEEIRKLLSNLEVYINNDNQDYDVLLKMALIHFQFESIHPFYNGNGRTGRILNVLYLVMQNKIKYPILCLSKYIIENKNEYYRLLRICNEDINNISEFVLYILKAVKETSKYTTNLILKIKNLIEITKIEMEKLLPGIYKASIVDHMFTHVYTKNSFFRDALGITKNAATKYLKLLVSKGFLIEEKVGKEVIYKNVQLFNIF